MKAGAAGIRLFFQDRRDGMSAQQEFYLARAAEAHADAAAATLGNVRDRWLLSAATWTEMAARSARGEKMRNDLIANKAGEGAPLRVGMLA
jgi:hypothetical protein